MTYKYMFSKINFVDVDLNTNSTSIRHSFMECFVCFLSTTILLVTMITKIFGISMDSDLVSSNHRNSFKLDGHNQNKHIKPFHEFFVDLMPKLKL